MPIVSIRHETTYRYRAPVAFGEHRMMLRPLETFDQRLLSASIEISPEPSVLRDLHDASGACVGLARFSTRADRLVFESRMRVDHRPQSPLDLDEARLSPNACAAIYEAHELAALSGFRRRLHPDAGETEAWARRFLRPVGETRVADLLVDMLQAIRGELAYALRLRGAAQSPAETLRLRQGSCRDFAVLMMEGARSLGLAAQFVSGYIYSSSAKAGRTGGGHTHAWARIFLPGCGWVDFDPTNGLIPRDGHITIAYGRDYDDVSPISGILLGGSDHSVHVGVDVSPVT